MKNFSNVPQVKFNRSKFDLSHGVKTTMSVGTLYPLKCLEVLPGDSFKSVMTAVVRTTSAFIKPIMDNLYLDVHSFFVPLRLLYNNSERVFGNPNPSAYTNNALASFPELPVSRIYSGTVGDYLGLPVDTGVSGQIYTKKGCSVLPFRAFAKIYNEWFRNENTVGEMYIQEGNTASSEYPNNNVWAPNNYTGKLPKVSKKKDYFTSCLPNTQKGTGVLVPLGTPYFPVVTRASDFVDTDDVHHTQLCWYDTDLDTFISAGTSGYGKDLTIGFDSNTHTRAQSNSPSIDSSVDAVPANLWAKTSGAKITVTDLRNAFQLQKMLERDARYGSRINEYLLGHFGVVSPDARLQFTEYLGGGRIPIGVQQVAQTSEGTANSPLANLGAFSQSLGRAKYSKGFVEHGYVITVGCIRQVHTYQQGIPRLFFRHKREDFYDPLLANISEQPVYKTQLFGYASSSSDTTELTSDAFGYNEAWADYRYEPSIVTGQMRSGISNTLDIWHLGDKYSAAPTLGQSFTDETSDFIDRALSVLTAQQDNFMADIWFDVKAIRVMPVYSTPGLVDHH